MDNYKAVGFGTTDAKLPETEKLTIPMQIKQFWFEIPAQYRLIYLLMFLYSHQDSKIIVFVSNCELVNFITKLCQTLNWNTASSNRVVRAVNPEEKE